jgi:hypothetical protein
MEMFVIGVATGAVPAFFLGVLAAHLTHRTPETEEERYARNRKAADIFLADAERIPVPPPDAGKVGIQPKRSRPLNPTPPRPTPRPGMPDDPRVSGSIKPPKNPRLIGDGY